MHDHVADGMLQFDHKGLTGRALRLHLDNSHDARTSGWDFDTLDQLHHRLHAEEGARLAEIEAAANLIAEGMAAAPPAVVNSIVGDYFTDANGTVYLAEQVDPRHMPAAGPLYRLTAQVAPAERVVDLLEQTRSSLAASRTYLDAHKESEGAHLSDRSGGATRVGSDVASPAPPRSGGAS